MNLPQRIIFSLIISVILFTVFSLAAFSGLFDLVEFRFYYPQLVKSLDGDVERLTQTVDTLLTGLQNRFAETLEDDAVKRSFLPGRKDEDVRTRAERCGLLMNSQPGLQSIRFVDAGGSGIHFSTLNGDLLSRTDSAPSYRSYQDCPGVLPYGEVETAKGQQGRIVFDGAEEQLIFSYPFSDSLDVYRGSALFTLSARAVTGYLIRQGQLRTGESAAVVDSPNGFLIGLPAAEPGEFKREAATAWHTSNLTLYNTNPAGAEPLMLVSAKSGTGFFMGRLVRGDQLTLPPAMRFILLGAFFLTVFLLIFLLFSLKQDNIAVIQARLKRLQGLLIRQYYENKGDIDWKRWSRELERRREDVRLEVMRGLPRTGKDKKKIDALIDRSWDELTAAVGGLLFTGFDEERIRSLIEKALHGAEPAGVSKPAEFEPAGQEILEELEVVETPEDPGNSPKAEEMEKVDIPEKISAENGPSAGEIFPAAFTAGNTDKTEPEPVKNIPIGEPVTPEELAALASRIEFGPDPEAPEGEDETLLELASPSLSFESPGFSGVERMGEIFFNAEQETRGTAQKNRQYEAGENSGLEDITEEGGQSLIYQPFLFLENRKPFVLRPLEEPGGEPIQEQNGLHLINSDILDPSLETFRTLDPKFLRLVESIIGKEHVSPK
ncbi:MAG: hypothetical protein LBI94_03675 [Treponema sp.]|nr:hypothetical protein [Treponema sp.]